MAKGGNERGKDGTTQGRSERREEASGGGSERGRDGTTERER